LDREKNKKERGEVTRRDFLIGAGAVVVGGAIGAGITYPLVAGKEGEVVTTTKVSTVPTTVTTTKTEGAATVTETKTVGAGETVTTTIPGSTVTVTQPGGGVEPAFEPEESTVLIPGPNALETGVADVKNGKIVRIRPLHLEEKYTKEELAPAMWKIEAKHRVTGETMTLESRMQSAPSYLALAYKKVVYSPNRVLWPLKRVDWEPGGDPAKINPQNRGKSKFKRISWDEATDIIASEIKRVQDKYGTMGVCIKADSWHRQNKTVHGGGLCGSGTMAKMLLPAGDFTSVMRNADSWEGWYYGTEHVWGTGAQGLVLPHLNLLLDTSENTDMIVYQGCDWTTTSAPPGGGWPSRAARWFNHLGIKQVYISPDMNYQQAANPDKWIPVLPGRDDALQMAIIYTWIDEDTYDKDYIETHTVGFDEYIKPYIMGDIDGVAKTPAWASPRCGVPEWTIKALARRWAKTRTSIGHGLGGPYIRGPYAHECARFEAILLGMQGHGKPGVNQCYGYVGPVTPPKEGARMGFFTMVNVMAADRAVMSPITKQIIAKTLVHKAILEGHSEQWGTSLASAPVEDQFIKYIYPIPAEEDGTEFHLIWQDHACQTGCWTDSNMYIHALRSPKIECHIIQHHLLENDCLFADIILPANTNLEEEDIACGGAETTTLAYRKAPVQPVGESMSDYEICCEVAKKLEKYGGRYADLFTKYTEGKTVEEWARFGFDNSGATDYITWEELKEKGYFVAPTVNPDWKELPRGLIEFYEDPVKNPLATPSGKLEFYSERLADKFPDDNERGPYPRYIIGGPGWTHDESLDIEYGAERCKKYPLLMQSNHVRWRVHVQGDDIPWLREIPTCKVKGPDGYMYEPLWINPVTAAKYGIKTGDIVKVYNDRGTELLGARVTERIRPGVVYADHGARVDMITCEDDAYSDRETKWINRGGTINNLSPANTISQNCPGMVVSAYLVEIEKLDPAEMEEWRKKYPEAFARDYDPAYGLKYGAWVEEV